MYIYLRKLKKVKSSKKNSSKSKEKVKILKNQINGVPKSSAAATNYTIDTLPGCYPDDEGQIIESVYVDPLTHDGAEYLVSDELANLSEADIHVLAAEDVEAGQHQIKQEEVDIIDVKPQTVVVEAPVVKSPTGGGLIYLQKLKKVKKPKKNKDKPEGQRSVKEFFTKKNKN